MLSGSFFFFLRFSLYVLCPQSHSVACPINTHTIYNLHLQLQEQSLLPVFTCHVVQNSWFAQQARTQGSSPRICFQGGIRWSFLAHYPPGLRSIILSSKIAQFQPEHGDPSASFVPPSQILRGSKVTTLGRHCTQDLESRQCWESNHYGLPSSVNWPIPKELPLFTEKKGTAMQIW